MSKQIKKFGLTIKGFTLVELLIVVAIIGILASQGVPAYRRMIQKSKKGEAQVMLGAISTAESAFQSEYGTFGNNITRMGAQMDGNNFAYTGGFPTGGCLTQAAADPTAACPNIAAFSGPYTLAANVNTVIGRPGSAAHAACDPRNTAGGAAAVAAFTASATGSIRQGVVDCGVLANCDQWTINDQRVLTNTVDGVQ